MGLRTKAIAWVGITRDEFSDQFRDFLKGEDFYLKIGKYHLDTVLDQEDYVIGYGVKLDSTDHYLKIADFEQFRRDVKMIKNIVWSVTYKHGVHAEPELCLGITWE